MRSARSTARRNERRVSVAKRDYLGRALCAPVSGHVAAAPPSADNRPIASSRQRQLMQSESVPRQLQSGGQEHHRTIPFADMDRLETVAATLA